jgi:predicted nuclease with TOPRIM domain
MKKMADMYEKTSLTLKETFDKRSQEFDNIQKESRLVLDEQNVTERRIKDVEDNSAKLHYELKVLNDKLKDIEDNVGTFYGKVGLLERRMDDSQQSITTMLIIGNYFNHYWLKVTEWIYGSSK